MYNINYPFCNFSVLKIHSLVALHSLKNMILVRANGIKDNIWSFIIILVC